jgi:hypothetical protein
MDRIRFWQQKISEATHALRAATKEELPVGSVVEYSHGRNKIQAEIIYDNGHGDLKVRGKSGREYWIDVDRVERKVS